MFFKQYLIKCYLKIIYNKLHVKQDIIRKYIIHFLFSAD